MSTQPPAPSLDRLLITATVLVLLVAVLAAALMAIEPQRNANAGLARHGEAIALGGALYDEHCRSCHGLRGEGVGQLGPPLADRHFFTTRLQEVGWSSTRRAYIIASTEHGRMMGTRPFYAGNGSTAVMAAWLDRHGGPLRADQIELLADFIENWEDTALGKVTLVEIAVPETREGDPQTIARGKAIFQSNCSECHTFQDIASTRYPGPALDGLKRWTPAEQGSQTPQDYIHTAILIPEEEVNEQYRQLADAHPCGAILTVTELHDVTAYLLQ